MADVFISYSSEDRNRVRPLAEALQARGFNIWWDRSLAAGQDFTTIIERELRAAKVVIVVWTQSSAASAFVRDEAGRARDERRLVPVMLDRVEIPLGFGAFQAEDFTQWNGGSNAPQMQVLEEAIKAKLEGREADGGAIASKRRQLMARVRVVSLLSVVALLIGIAVGGKYLFAPPEADLRAQLLQLLAEGTITPEQAIELAQLLESDSLGGERVAMVDDGASSSPSSSSTAEESPAVDAQLASVSEAEFDTAARETYRAAFLSPSIPKRKCGSPWRKWLNRTRATLASKPCGPTLKATRTIRFAMRFTYCAERLASVTTTRSGSAPWWRPPTSRRRIQAFGKCCLALTHGPIAAARRRPRHWCRRASRRKMLVATTLPSSACSRHCQIWARQSCERRLCQGSAKSPKIVAITTRPARALHKLIRCVNKPWRSSRRLPLQA